MVRPQRPDPSLALELPSIESRPKRVEEDVDFYVGVKLTERQLKDLNRIRSLISVGGDLSPYYRRSRAFDALLRRQQILHLHLGGPASDAILYLVQYPDHVLFLAVDSHVHLEDIPPGKRFQRRGRLAFARNLQLDATERQRRLAASLRRLQSGEPER